jgi:hypothetical protein
MGGVMASYQNPNHSADSLPPSALNWGDSLDPQDAPPYGHVSLPPINPNPFLPNSPVNPPLRPPVPESAPVQHAFQPHPFAEPQPYRLAAPPLHDVPPPQYAPGGLDYGYGSYGYAGPEPGESGKARAALWIGILGGWLPINLFVALAGILETGPGRKRGRDKAVIGLCCSLVWVVLIGGIAYAVGHHRLDAAPPMPRQSTVSAGSDPGCYAGANALYAYQGSGRGATAQSVLGDALIAAAGRSEVADAPLRKLGLDYLALAGGSAVPGLAADAAAAGDACGLSFVVN